MEERTMFRSVTQTVAFIILSFLQFNAYSDIDEVPPLVKVLYFQASDVERPTDENLDVFRNIMLETHNHYRSEMKRHGFGQKTFSIDLKPDRDVNISLVRGKHKLQHYQNFDRLEADLPNAHRVMIGDTDNIQVIFLGNAFAFKGFGGLSIWKCAARDKARERCKHNIIIPTENWNLLSYVAAHEIGHAFWLQHNPEEGFLMHPKVIDLGVPQQPEKLSLQEATLLNRHRYFHEIPLEKDASASAILRLTTLWGALKHQ